MKIIFKIIKILIGSFFLLFSIAGVSIIIEDGFDIGMFIFAIVTFIPGILLISSSIKKKGGKDNKKVLDILKPLESSNINEIETNSNSTEKIDFTKKSIWNKSKVKPSYKNEPKTNTIFSNNSSSIGSLGISTSTTSYYVERTGITPKNVYISDDLFYIRGNVTKSRGIRNMTQAKLSELLGYKSTSFISNLERGNLSKITHEQVEDLARCLEIQVDDLLIGYKKI